MSLKNGRPKPVQRTERERVVRRLEQASRAIEAHRNVEKNRVRAFRLGRRLTAIDTPATPEVPA